MSLNEICEKYMKRMLPTKILQRGSTTADGPMETRQVYRLLQCVIQRNKAMVEKLVHLGVSDLINLTEPNEGICALHRVSEDNDLDMAQFLLSLKAHPDIQDKMGRTALMLAAGLGHLEMVELLTSHQASWTLLDADGKGLLFYCLNPAKPQLLEMALDMGAEVNNVSYAGQSVFMFACEQAKRSEDVCMWLLEKGADPNVADPETGSTPLIEAVKAQSVPLMRAILQRGGNPNAVDSTRMHAAHFAASKGLLEVLWILSAYSAEFNLQSVREDTALHLAAAEGHTECCRFLFQRGCCMMRNLDGLLPSQVAKINKQTAALKELVKANQPTQLELPTIEARLHDWSLDRKAALLQAFQSAEGADAPVETVSTETFVSVLQAHRAPVDDGTLKSIVDVLIVFSDQINIEEFFMGSKFLPSGYELSSYKSLKVTETAEKAGSSLCSDEVPPHTAKKMDDTGAASSDLVQAKRSKDPSSYFDEPEEDYVNVGQCIATNDTESLELAFSQYVSVDVRDRYYKTPLMSACIRGNYQMAHFLILNKANVNAHDQLKWTSLHHACFSGHADIVNLLLQHKAIVDPKTTSRVTPLMRAIQSCKPKCVQLLLEAGADVEATNMRDQSCELVAQLYGNEEICDLIKSEKERREQLKQAKKKKGTKQKAAPRSKPTAAKNDAPSEETTTDQSSSVIALNPDATHPCITLPSLTVWGDMVPMNRQLKERKRYRLDCYKSEDKLAFNPESTERIPKPPKTPKKSRPANTVKNRT